MSAADDEFDWDKVREWRRVQKLMIEDEYSEIIRSVTAKIETAIVFYNRVKIDEYGTVTLGTWGGYFIQAMPMAFNDRLVMTPMDMPLVYDYGWWFRKGAAVLLAALAWDPQRNAEPLGYLKRIGLKRLAGQRAARAPQPNR